MKFLPLVCALLICSVGCKTSMDVNPIRGQAFSKLERGHKAYIALPEDGRYAAITYTGSGMQVASHVAKALTAHASSTVNENQILPLETLLQKAVAADAKYLFVPLITHWEPRVASVSGRPTRVHLEMRIYDTATGVAIASNSIDVTGRRVTVASQSADGLAAVAIQDLVDSFF